MAMVLVLTSDLAVASFVRGAIAQSGGECGVALDADSLFKKLAESVEPPLVIVNLETRGLVIAELLTLLNAAAVPPSAVIAFGPHVHEERLQAARDAGCTEVVSKGKFHAQAAELIARHLPRPGH